MHVCPESLESGNVWFEEYILTVVTSTVVICYVVINITTLMLERTRLRQLFRYSLDSSI